MPGGFRLALSAYVFWGLSPLYWKMLDSIPATQITAHRFVQAMLLGIGFQWFAKRRSPVSLFRDRRLAVVHLGAGLLLGLNWVVFVYAINTDRVLDTSLGYFINPLFSVLLGMVVLGERLTPARWAAVTLAAVGVTLLTIEAGQLPWISLVLAVTFAVYGLVKKLSPRDSFAGLTTEMIWLAPIAFLYLGWLAASNDLDFGTGSATWAIWAVGLVTATPLVLFGAATKRIPLWMIGLLQFLAPSIQFVLGVFVFDERVTALRLAGFGVIWLGLVVFGIDTRRSFRSSVVVVETPTGLAAE